MIAANCENCWYYDYDEDLDDYYCIQDLDEDEVYRIQSSRSKMCPYFREGDEYAVAKKQ